MTNIQLVPLGAARLPLIEYSPLVLHVPLHHVSYACVWLTPCAYGRSHSYNYASFCPSQTHRASALLGRLLLDISTSRITLFRAFQGRGSLGERDFASDRRWLGVQRCGVT